jgi:molecular chaperone DnaJ
MEKDYYVVLGVSRGADIHKIKKAFRQIVKQHHPDANPHGHDAGRFREAKEAYETLSDETKRRRYDEALSRRRGDVRISGVTETIRRRRAPLEDLDPLVSLTDEFFGGFVPGFLPDFFEKEHGRGKDLFLDLVLTPQEAFQGGLFPITVPVIEPCPRCERTGMWEDFYCPVCMGSGRMRGRREFSLSIPPHVPHGTHVRLPLSDIGLAGVYLDITVLIEPYLGPDW